MQRGFLSQLRRLWIVMTILVGLSGMALGVSMQIAASGSDCGHGQQDCCEQEKQESCHGTVACVCVVPDSGLDGGPVDLPKPAFQIVFASFWSVIRLAFGEQIGSVELTRLTSDLRVPADWLVDSAGPRAPPY